MTPICLDIPGLDRIPHLGKGEDKRETPGMYCLAGYPFPQTFGMIWREDESEPDTWFIIEIQVHSDYRGRGLASQILKRIVEAADNQGVALKLTVEPLGASGLDIEQLSDWYRRAGFEFDPDFCDYLMRRPPSNVAQCRQALSQVAKSG